MQHTTNRGTINSYAYGNGGNSSLTGFFKQLFGMRAYLHLFPSERGKKGAGGRPGFQTQ